MFVEGRVSISSIVVAVKDQLSCDLAGEAVILNLKSGMYYGLDPVGARIWQLIQVPMAVKHIQDTILDEYDVEASQVRGSAGSARQYGGSWAYRGPGWRDYVNFASFRTGPTPSGNVGLTSGRHQIGFEAPVVPDLSPFSSENRIAGRLSYRTDRPSIQRVVWAMAVVSQYLPGVRTCLMQALATYVLLRRCGHTAYLRIGVARSEDGQLQAHAWVETGGRIVIGDMEDVSRYTPMPPLEGNGL
jgi:hypothetical protein